jgi:hypothetical protein
MKRLIVGALPGNELHDIHHVRDCLNGTADGPTDVNDYDGIWERAARRARKVDPDGSRSLEVLRQLELRYHIGLGIRHYAEGRVPLFVN